MKIKISLVKDLAGKKPAELDAYVTDLQKQLAELLHQIALNKEKQTHQIGMLKKAIAKAHTVKTTISQGKER